MDRLSPDDVAKAVAALKGNFVCPKALSDAEMARATLDGLLDRLAPEVSLVTGTASPEAAPPFYSEIYGGKTGYLRPGKLTQENIAKSRQTLVEWSGTGVAAVVLDLRGTPASSDFEAGSDLERLFCSKETAIFSLRATGQGHSAQPLKTGSSAEAIVTPSTTALTYSAKADPLFKGILVVLVDGETAEAPEAVAASLQKCSKALVVGERTAGRAFDYRDFPLDGAVLRVAVAQVILPDGKELGEHGLKPDIDVALGSASKQEALRSVSTKGVESVIEEYDRPHLNEAALVARSNPEVDELEAEEGGKKPEERLIDRQLQRALDLVTSISIYQVKGRAGPAVGQ